jgi:hypothetical protein
MNIEPSNHIYFKVISVGAFYTFNGNGLTARPKPARLLGRHEICSQLEMANSTTIHTARLAKDVAPETGLLGCTYVVAPFGAITQLPEVVLNSVKKNTF